MGSVEDAAILITEVKAREFAENLVTSDIWQNYKDGSVGAIVAQGTKNILCMKQVFKNVTNDNEIIMVRGEGQMPFQLVIQIN